MIYLADADGTIPNLALMRLSAYFRSRGETVRLIRPADRRTLFDPIGDVYGSSIFTHATKAREKIEREWGVVRWGGTGVRVASNLSEIASDVEWDAIAPDFSLYPDFTPSLGFATRGCRLRCGFCVVPEKEGRPRAVAGVASIWRGAPHPRNLLLLDNDPFAPQLRDHWRSVVEDLRAHRFKVCFSQGINLRLVDDESAAALASIEYRDNEFRERRLYTAWDSLRDEGIFRAGVDRLRRAGIPSKHLMVYALCGYAPGETWDDIFYRFFEIVGLGAMPYPMVYDRSARPDLCAFQRWVLRGLYRAVPWPDYARDGRGDRRISRVARAESDAAWGRAASARIAYPEVFA